MKPLILITLLFTGCYQAPKAETDAPNSPGIYEVVIPHEHILNDRWKTDEVHPLSQQTAVWFIDKKTHKRVEVYGSFYVEEQ